MADGEEPQRIPEGERRLMQQIRELDMEELQVEEVDDDFRPSDDDDDIITSGRGDGGAGPHGGFTFDTCLASMHTYLGEVNATHRRLAFLDGGAILNLPMFYLEGVVLFPEATLPLRVIQPRFIAAVERALNRVDTPYTIGVIRVYSHPDDGRLFFATTGTTAEIRQYRRLEDGTLNVVARGQQRFRVRRCWIDVEGAPCAEVQIVQEDTPLRTPRAAFGQLASVRNLQKHTHSRAVPLCISSAKLHGYEDAENDSECMSGASIASDNSELDMTMCLSESESHSHNGYEKIDESSSSDDELDHGQGQGVRKSYSRSSGGQLYSRKKVIGNDRFRRDSAEEPSSGKRSCEGEKRKDGCVVNDSKPIPRAAMSFWPRWVYQLYDAYSLAQRAADLWRQVIVGNPSLDDYVRKPDILSFYIASKLPMSEATRQELLEIDGISYRLQREIQLLKCFNLVHCKVCRTLIAERSDMVVMSSDGPVNAYVNPHGFVHEIITVHNAKGLDLFGSRVKAYSWFPGYSWRIANCGSCQTNMGWLFEATRKELKPRSFWGIRSSQIADET